MQSKKAVGKQLRLLDSEPDPEKQKKLQGLKKTYNAVPVFSLFLTSRLTLNESWA